MKAPSSIKLLIAPVFFLASAAALANGGGNGVGNGGDPLRPLFAKAQSMAAEKAARVVPCALPAQTPAGVRDWIIAHRAELAADIQASQHAWITDPQPTCAWTQDASAASITLSFEACRPLIRTEADAMRILVHESVHHFGITDEAFADQVAAALESASGVTSCPAGEQEAFDPNACSGAPIDGKGFLSFFPAGGGFVRIGKPTPVQYRRRECLGQTEDTCTEWKYFTTVTRDSHTYAGEAVFAVQPEIWIREGMAMTLQGNEMFGMQVTGLGTERISADMSGPYFPWTGLRPGPRSSYDRAEFHGRGRMTRECLVLQSRLDLENEAAILIRF